MKNRSKILFACVCILLTVVLVVLVKTVDVAPTAVEGTEIGLSGINFAFHDATGVHLSWYKITQILGYAALAVAAGFALAGVVQWIKRRSLIKVDKIIFALGGL